MQIFVHVGLHKTGTSAVQKYLNENRDILLSHGVYYPDTGDSDAHHGLASLLRVSNGMALTQGGGEIFVSKFQRFIQEADENKLLISSEIFSEEVDLSVFKNLSNEDADLKVIIYLRRQDLLLESAFNQMLKQYGSYKEDILSPPIYSVNFDAVINRWENVVGEGNVIVKRYQKSSMVDGDVITDFLAAIEVDPSLLPNGNDAVVNESLSLLEARVLNDFAKYGFKDWAKISEFVKAYVGNHYAGRDGRMVGNYLGVVERKIFYESLRESNIKVLNKFFKNESELFSQEFGNVNDDKSVTIDPIDILVDFFNANI